MRRGGLLLIGIIAVLLAVLISRVLLSPRRIWIEPAVQAIVQPSVSTQVTRVFSSQSPLLSRNKQVLRDPRDFINADTLLEKELQHASVRCKKALVVSVPDAFVGPCGSIQTLNQSYFWYDFNMRTHSGFCAQNYFQSYRKSHPQVPMVTEEDVSVLSPANQDLSTWNSPGSSTSSKQFKLISVMFLWASEFPHVMKDLLPRIVLTEPIFRNDSSTLYLLVDSHAIRKVLKFLSIPLSRVFFVSMKEGRNRSPLYYPDCNSIYFASSVILPICMPGPHTTGYYAPALYRNVRERLELGLSASGPTEPPFILYVSRGGGRNSARNVENAAEILEALGQHFKVVEFDGSETSFKESLWLFKNAQLILGPHGGGFYNILACSPGAKVIEFVPDDYGKHEVGHIAEALELDHISFVKKNMKKTEDFGKIDVSWVVDLVKTHLQDKKDFESLDGWRQQ